MLKQKKKKKGRSSKNKELDSTQLNAKEKA